MSTQSIQTHFFKPKSAQPDAPNLLVVAIEESKELGSASALAKKLGFKDMRALSGDQVKELVGVSKEGASPLLLSSSSLTKLVFSSTLSETLQIPSRNDPTTKETITLTELVKSVEEKGFQIEKVEFNEKGAAATTTKPTAANTSASAVTPASSRHAEEPSTKEGLGVSAKKEEDFPEWYQQVLKRGDMIEYYDISGCYIFKPWSYGIWQDIQYWFDKQIKRLGVQNAYFPMFVSSDVLEKEKDHIEGFAPEVAWVTKAGSSDLEKPIAIRPTSETVMYPYYAKWIRSHRDLPLKINQWNNVVRWEFKNPQPFLRTREFLWQEGHTAHFSKTEADEMVSTILDLYRRVYEELLAVPVIPGVKTEKEKFAGGLYTTTVEGFIPTAGRGIQGATSHNLGQNFSKMFGIQVEDPDNPINEATGKEAGKLFVWQTSWGITTRTIGVMVMIHSDDKGLVLPPKVAQLQVVIVPTGITKDTSEEKKTELMDAVKKLKEELEELDIRVKVDDREGYTPGFKYNDWEMRGVPIRIELGPKDLSKTSFVAVRRDTGVKQSFPLSSVKSSIPSLLETIQSDLFEKAKKQLEEGVVAVTDWKDFVPSLNSKKICAIPWCEVEKCEDEIKERSAKESAAVQDERAPSAGAKSLCIPYNQSAYPPIEPGKTECTNCGKEAKKWTLFGRSY